MKKWLVLTFVLLVIVISGIALLAWYERDRVTVQVLNRVLSEYGITVIRVKGLQPGRGRLSFEELTWKMRGSEELQFARGFSSTFRLSPFFMQRAALDELQVVLPDSSESAAGTAPSFSELLGQWRALPVGAIDLALVRVNHSDPVAVSWQRKAGADRLRLKYQDMALRAEAGLADEISLNLVLLQNGTTLLEVAGAIKGGQPTYPLALQGDTDVAALWPILKKYSLIPPELDARLAAVSGKIKFELDTVITDDLSALPLQVNMQIVAGSALKLTVAGLPALQSGSDGRQTSAADVALLWPQPMQISWQNDLQTVRADALKITGRHIETAADMTLDVTQLICTAPDQCRGDFNSRVSVSTLLLGDMDLQQPAVACSGNAVLAGQTIDVTAKAGCGANAQRVKAESITVVTPALSATGLRLRYTLADDWVDLGATKVRVTAAKAEQAGQTINGDLQFEGLSLSHTIGAKTAALRFASKVAVNGLSVDVPEQWLPTLSAQGRLDIAKDRVKFDGEMRSVNDAPLAEIQLAHNIATERGSADVTLKTNTLGLDRKALSSWFRGWPYPADLVAGKIEGDVAIQWRPTKAGVDWQGSGALRLRNIAGKYDDIGGVGINATIAAVIDNGEVRSLRPGTLQVDRLDVGMPITDFVTDFTFDTAKHVYRIISMDAQLLGGSVHAGAYDYFASNAASPLPRDMPWAVSVNGIALERVLELAAFEAVSGRGLIDGELPLRFDGKALTTDSGWLAGRGSGVLRYQSATGKAVAATNASLQLVTEALANYHYETLRADATLNQKGDLKLGIVMRGVNPEMRGGQRINLNLNVENNIPDLLRTLQAGRIIDDVLEQQLRKRR